VIFRLNIMSTRKAIKVADETALLTQCLRLCCLCYFLKDDRTEKRGQIAHIDHDRSNNKLKNLVWLCFDHHDIYDSQTRQSKGLTAGEVIKYKERLESLVAKELSAPSREPLVLLDSFPKGNQSIRLTELNNFFLKFNKPVDRESSIVIRNHYMRLNLDVQWTVGGWIQYKEDDAKLIWHPHSAEVERIKLEAQKTRVGEHTFEVLIGTNKGNRVRGRDGSTIEPTFLEVSVDTSDTLSRAELVRDAILEIDGLAGYRPPNEPTFDDVPTTHWCFDWVESAVQLGITSGYSDANGSLTGLFGPDDSARRAWATKILVNTFSIPTTLAPTSPFKDVTTSHEFHDYVLTAYNQSVVDESVYKMFRPDDLITRAVKDEWVARAKNPVLRP